jgi:ATP-dependent Clp protease ATP-binding subunit ClpB
MSCIGEFEKRFKALISDMISESGNVILFADEIHQLVGMGAGPGAPMDAANIIKPALARYTSQ